jgi:hypothetical protein
MNSRTTVKCVRADGSNGHVYFYRMPSTETTFGGIMVGLEGSEWGKKDAVGGYHGMSAKSTPYSLTYGYKWHSKEHIDLSSVKGPGKYDCMYIDLSSGWEFLVDAYAYNWRDEYVTQTSLPVPEDPIYKDFVNNLEDVVKGRTILYDDIPLNRREQLQESLRSRHLKSKFDVKAYQSHLVMRKAKLLKICAPRPYKTYEEVINEIS